MKEIIDEHEILVSLNLSVDAFSIYIVSDASLAGIGEYICQEEMLQMAKSIVYHSRVFTTAQSNHFVHEQELLVLEDLIKFYEH